MFHSSKNLSDKIKKLIQKNDVFVLWILIVLSVDYLGLFFVESILPGYVMSNLNLNFLLIFLLIGWLFYSISVKPKKALFKHDSKIFRIILLTIFALGTIFTLYKMTDWELFISFLFLTLIGSLLYKELKSN